MAKSLGRHKLPIILFDIDYTLFDANKFRRKIFRVIKKNIEDKEINNIDSILKSAYIVSRKDTGHFRLSLFLEALATGLNKEIAPITLEKAIFREDIFTGNLYEGAKKVLQSLSKNKLLKIGIFSAGDDAFQRKKIKEIENFLHKDHIHIFTFKKSEKLDTIVKRYKKNKLYIVDDKLEILYAAKSLNKTIFCIWIKRRKFATQQEEIFDFRPDAIVVDLREVVKIISP